MNRFKPYLHDRRVHYVLIYFIFLLLLTHVKPTGGDDVVYQSKIIQMGFLSWIQDLYLLWSGRIVLTGLLAVFLNLPILLWKLLNAFFLTYLVYGIECLTFKDMKLRFLIFAFILLIPAQYMSSSAFWVTGSFNYLWPISSLLFILLRIKDMFLNIDQTNVLFGISLLATLISGNNEQSALVSIVFLSFALVYRWIKYRTFKLKDIALWVFTLLNFLILMLAPGNFIRYQAEMLLWKSNFEMYNLVDQFMIGSFATLNVLFNHLQVYLMVLSFVLILKNVHSKMVNRVFSFVPMLIMLFKLMMDYIIKMYPYCTQCNDIHYIFFNFAKLDLNYNHSIITYIPMIVGFVYIFSVVLIVFHDEEWKEPAKLFYGLIFLASIFSGIMLGFSPTIEASGSRIYFLMIIGLISFIMAFIGELKRSESFNSLLSIGLTIAVYESIFVIYQYYSTFNFEVIY